MTHRSYPSVDADYGVPLQPTNGTGHGRSNENMSSTEAWLSVAAGVGLVWSAWRCWSLRSLPLAAAGGSLLYQGATRHCPVYSVAGIDHSQPRSGPDAVCTVIVNKPAEEVYAFWRDLSNAPRFMTMMDRVDVLDERRSRWHTHEIGGRSFDYLAEITDDTPNSGLKWRSVEGSPVEMRGSVRFKPAPGGRGTVVIASVIFGGDERNGLRAFVARPFAKYKIHEDLVRFKQLVEANEIATTEGQPVGLANSSHPHRETQSQSPQTGEPGAGAHESQAQAYGASQS